jgi:hypothetical protein
VSSGGRAVVAGAAVAVANGGNSESPRPANRVAAVATVAAAGRGGGKWASAAEPFAWLWARRGEGGRAAEVEARAAYLLRFAQEAFAALATREPDPGAAERDAFEERAAILEHDARLPRAEAERRAAEMHLANARPREA